MSLEGGRGGQNSGSGQVWILKNPNWDKWRPRVRPPLDVLVQHLHGGGVGEEDHWWAICKVIGGLLGGGFIRK